MHCRKRHDLGGTSGRLWLGVCCLALFGGGCDTDSFMDPSVVGRWEYTPVVLPIIDRLDVIDGDEEQVPGLDQVKSDDLIPEIAEYVIGAGDLLTVTVLGLLTPDVETVQTRRVDELGRIRLPVIGELKVAGLTSKQLEQRLIDILDPAILKDPTVTAVIQEGRQRKFSILGPTGSGTYTIVENNFRLLDALALSGGIAEGVERVFVIRQAPLNRIVEEGVTAGSDDRPGAQKPPLRRSGAPEGQVVPGKAPKVPQPEGGADPAGLIEDLSKGVEDKKLPTLPSLPNAGRVSPVAPSLSDVLEPANVSAGRYINVNGKWILVAADQAAPRADAGRLLEGELPPPEELVTQRVVEVDAKSLLQGDARQNLVVRAGDIVRVPLPLRGNVYIGGEIARPGTYTLPGERKLTLKQLVISAGGLSPIGIPERVDLIRRIGDDQEATVRLNLRAIFEGVQPDIFLKPDDTVNVGTNALAPFAAVMRNAFRASYGFGFLLDRNFGNDTFGAPPTNQR
ncbi:MAG: polysaccharide biosynthesis/export family protein [Phycisphaerae bacterium]|nr:polysaccharide biosynthesis/export family protein [Phycisphaerae bacterium]